MDLQGYTCKVKHRSGDKNLLADAVSRLFRVNDIPPVLTVDELRDDFGPLTEEEKNKFEHFGTEQGFIIETIEEHRREMGQIMREQLQDRVSQMVTERRSDATKQSRKQPKKEGDTRMEAEDKTKKGESLKQEADVYGIVETVSNDQVSGRLMKYITDEDFTKIEEDCYQHPVVIQEEQIPEEHIYVSMQQIMHEGRAYQLQRRRKTRRGQEDEDDDYRYSSEKDEFGNKVNGSVWQRRMCAATGT
jgi:hypothetical protein